MSPDFLKQSNRIFLGVSLFMLAFVIYPLTFSNGMIFDGHEYALGRDFFNIWHHGVAAWSDDPTLWYRDSSAYNARLDAVAGFDYPDQRWSLPPHTILVMAPFGLLPYNIATIVFTALSIWLYNRYVVADAADSLMKTTLFAVPAFIFAVYCGQFSLLAAVIFVILYKHMDTKPILCACLLALMTLKPQLGGLFPIFLLATGRYRLFLYAAIASVALIGSSALLFGPEIWLTYFDVTLGGQMDLAGGSHPFVLGMMPTLFVQLQMFGLSSDMAGLVHGVFALAAVCLMVLCVRRTQDRDKRYAAFIATALVFSPYLMMYDTLVLAWVMLVLWPNQWGPVRKSVFIAVATLPLTGIVLSMSLGLGTGFVIWAMAALSWHDALKKPSAEPENVTV